MSERALFFDSVSGDREYTSTDFAKAFGGIVKNGVVPNSMNELQCRFGNGMEILVDTGEAWVNGRYYANENEQKSLMIPTADAAYSRIDRVVIRLDLNIEIRSIETIVKTGTPAENPVASELQQDSLIYEFPLYQYTVEVNASNPSNLIDERQFIQTNELIMFEAFNDFVKGMEPHGGVVRIEAEDLPSNAWKGTILKGTKELGQRSGGTYIICQPEASCAFTFWGTGITLLTKNTDYQTYEITVDNLPSFTIETIDYVNDIDSFQMPIKLIENLSVGYHTIKVKNISSVNVAIDAFDIIQTTDNTLHVNSGTAYTSGIRKNINEDNYPIIIAQPGDLGRVDTLVTDKNGQTYFAQGIDGENELAYRVEENGLISNRYRGKQEEWFEDRVKVWNSGITSNHSTGWLIENVENASGNSQIISNKLDAVFCIGFVGTGIDIIKSLEPSEGIFGYSIDDGSEHLYDAYSSEPISRYRINLANNLSFGYHEVKLRVTGTKNTSSINTIVRVGSFDVYLPKEPKLSADTQPICNVLVSPLPGEVEKPARPNSEQEAGWIRYEENEGVVYTGNWEEYSSMDFSKGTMLRTYSEGGEYAEFTFIGTGIRFIGHIFDNGVRNAYIYVDDIFYSTITEAGEIRQNQVILFEATGLSFETHTIKVEPHTNMSPPFYIDAFEVYQPYYLVEDLRAISPMKLDPVISGEEGVKVVQNENGTAWLHPDGRAECWYLKPEELATTSTSGNLHFTTIGSMYYPIIWATGKPEVVLPMSQIVSGSTNVWMNISLAYETYCAGLLWSSTTNGKGYPGFYAKGRWK